MHLNVSCARLMQDFISVEPIVWTDGMRIIWKWHWWVSLTVIVVQQMDLIILWNGFANPWKNTLFGLCDKQKFHLHNLMICHSDLNEFGFRCISTSAESFIFLFRVIDTRMSLIYLDHLNRLFMQNKWKYSFDYGFMRNFIFEHGPCFYLKWK